MRVNVEKNKCSQNCRSSPTNKHSRPKVWKNMFNKASLFGIQNKEDFESYEMYNDKSIKNNGLV